MKRTRTARSSGLPDVAEAAKAVRQIARAIRQDIKLRMSPSMDDDYSSVLSKISAALAMQGKGLKELQRAAEDPSGTGDVEERLALLSAVLDLIKAAQLLGDVL